MNDIKTMSRIEKSASCTIENHVHNYIRASGLKDSSKTTYRSLLINFATWLHKKNIIAPTEHTIIEFCDYLKKDKNLSSFSINGYLTAIKSFFAWLESVHIYRDIAHTIHGPKKIAGSRKKSLSLQQVKRLFKAIDGKSLEDKRDFALINLMIGTGLRSIEITTIMRGDIANCCGVQVLWVAIKEGEGKDRDIHLSDTLFNPIHDYLAARKSTNDTDPLFASHSKKNFGQPLTSRSVTRIIKKRLNAAELDTVHISPSSLRYTAIRLKKLA